MAIRNLKDELIQAAGEKVRQKHAISDFDQIVDSYMPAAVILGLTRQEVESAVFRALRIERSCESCRYSRAPHNVLQMARQQGILAIYWRCCIRRPRQRICPEYERLEVPQDFLDREEDMHD